jgi:hypothetical protein
VEALERDATRDNGGASSWIRWRVPLWPPASLCLERRIEREMYNLRNEANATSASPNNPHSDKRSVFGQWRGFFLDQSLASATLAAS